MLSTYFRTLAAIALMVPLSTAAQTLKDDRYSWLIADSATSASPADEFLDSLGGRMRVLGVWYEGNRLHHSKSFVRGQLTSENAVWASETTLSKNSEHLDVSIKLQLTSGSANSFGVAVAFDFTSWGIENYVLAPGLIYEAIAFVLLILAIRHTSRMRAIALSTCQ